MATFLERLGLKRRKKEAGVQKQTRTEEAGAAPAPQHVPHTGDWQMVQTYQIPSAPGNERLAMTYVTEAVKAFHLPERRLDQLGTAVAEATMNAMEHGNHYDPQLPVTLQILSSDRSLAVRISDKSGTSKLPAPEEYEVPDIEAKLAELQSPRGWGLFLIQNMVDEMHILNDEDTHTIELILHLEEGSNGR